MAIEIAFGEQELRKAATPRFSVCGPYARVVAFVHSSLSEMGIADGRASLIYAGDRLARVGSVRAPVLIESADTRFVIKPYDRNDQVRERRVLRRVAGKIAPKLVHIGETFYAEDFVDSATHRSLESLADSGPDGLAEAVVVGGRMHARLARMGIDYNHNHWLDEFFVGPRHRIVDFGDAREFVRHGQYPRADEEMGLLADLSPDAYLCDVTPIESFDNSVTRYGETRDRLWSLSDSPEVLWNLLSIVRSAAIGLWRYATVIEARCEYGLAHWPLREIPKDAWGYTLELFPDFVASFAHAYATPR